MPLGICRHLAREVMKRGRRGLYAGERIRFGDQISEDGGNRTKRTWKPNVQWKRVFSLALDEMVRIRMTTQALHQIDAAGGIDEYLLNTPEEKLNSDVGMKLRGRIVEALEIRRKGRPAQVSQ